MLEEVFPRIWVGGDKEYERVKGRAGWSYLRTCKEGPDGHRQLLGYHTLGAPKGANYLWYQRGHILALNILDLDDPEFFAPEMIERGFKFLTDRLKAGDKVAVCCNQGHSRGPTLVLLYLRAIGEMPFYFHRAEKIFRTLYPRYDPGMGIREFARAHWSDYKGEAE